MGVIDFPTQGLAASSLEELARGWAGLGLGGDLCAGPIEPGQQWQEVSPCDGCPLWDGHPPWDGLCFV